MRFGTHKGNWHHGYAPLFNAWANADQVAKEWQEYWQDKAQYRRPAANIIENEGDFTIELAAAGLQKEDFKIEVKNKQLVIWTEVKAQENTKKYTHREFGFGNFKRTFTLPDTVDSENISAKYTDGVLYVHIPKVEKANTSRSIQID